MRRLLLFFALAAGAFAQGQAVNQVGGPTPDSWVANMTYSGSNLSYVCWARALQPVTTFYESSSTLTNIVVSTGTATITFSSTSYLWIGAQITVAGSTTTALNGTYKVTGVASSTATFTTAAGDATYNNAALTVSTTAPLLNAAVWSIQELVYSSSNVVGVYWAGTPSIVPSQGLACSNGGNY
jgi:hypothetical protein